MDAIIKALDHELRRNIIKFINETPGARYSDILNHFKLRRGTLNFHLKLIQPLVIVEDSYYYLNEEGRKSIQMMRIMDGHESLKIKSLLFSAEDAVPNTKGFLGREQILKSFLENRFIIIEGIAGIGKTYLAARIAMGMKAEIFWHQFRPVDTFDYIIQKLAVFLYKQGLEDLLNYLESGGTDRNVCLLLIKKITPANNALFFDDLHIVSDKEIFTLLSSFKNAACFVVVTSRHTPRLDALSENTHIIRLEGLSHDETKRFLEIRGIKLSEDAFEKLYRKTGGHPLALKFLSISRENIEDITKRIPEANIEGFLWTEIYTKLTGDQKEMMKSLSVFREPVPIEALRAVYDGEMMLETLLSLKEMLLVEESAGRYFTHDMVHEFCYKMVDDPETSHIKASKYYEKMTGSPETIEYIYHLLMAEEYEEASRIALSKSGKIIMQGYLLDFYNILTLFPESQIPSRDRTRFYLVRGRILDIWGRWEEALEDFKKALDVSESEARRGEALRNIADIKRKKGEWDEAERYYKESEKIAESMNDMTELSRIYADLGSIFRNKGELESAMEYHKKSLQIREGLGDKRGVSQALGSIGSIYRKKGELESAMEYHKKSLQIREGLGDKRGVSQALGSIGSIYRKKGELESAMEYHKKSLQIREEIGDSQGMAQAYGSIGSIYRRKKMIEEALQYHTKSLQIRERLGDMNGVAIALGSLGSCHILNKDYASAQECLNRSLKIREELGDIGGQGNIYLSLAILAMLDKNLTQAEEYLLKAKGIAESSNRILEGKVEKEMADLCVLRGDLMKAASHYKIAIEIFQTLGLKQELAETCLEYFKNFKDEDSRQMLRKSRELFIELGDEKTARKIDELIDD
jgi:tetratricopeptide (TPR) repeat protein